MQFYFFLELDGVNAPGLPDTKEYMTLLAPGYTGNEKLGGKTRYGALVSVATTEWVKLKPNRDNFRYKYHRPPQVCIPMDGEVHRVRIHAYIKTLMHSKSIHRMKLNRSIWDIQTLFCHASLVPIKSRSRRVTLGALLNLVQLLVIRESVAKRVSI